MAEIDAKRKVARGASSPTKLAAVRGGDRARTAEAMASVRGIAADAATAIVERLTGQAPRARRPSRRRSTALSQRA